MRSERVKESLINVCLDNNKASTFCSFPVPPFETQKHQTLDKNNSSASLCIAGKIFVLPHFPAVLFLAFIFFHKTEKYSLKTLNFFHKNSRAEKSSKPAVSDLSIGSTFSDFI